MKSITIIMKPTSECNMRCQYCYHAETEYEKGIMKLEVLKQIISKVQSEYDDIMYVWHGGEPLLCGIDFFRQAFAYQKEFVRNHMRIRNCIQTNGTLLTPELLQLCYENNVSISISFDGPNELNQCRQQTENAEYGIELACNSGVRTSILSVINCYNVTHMIDLYEYAKRKKVPLKMNPVFKTSNTEYQHYLLSEEIYIQEFKKLFDYWLYDIEARADVEPIMQYLKMYFQGKGTECVYGSCLYRWLAFMHDGTIYPCGRNYPSKYQLGNIASVSVIHEAFETEAYRELTISSIIRRTNCEQKCKYYHLCHSGCNSNCLINGELDVPNQEICEIFKGCYGYVEEKIRQVLDGKDRKQEPNAVIMAMLKMQKEYT